MAQQKDFSPTKEGNENTNTSNINNLGSSEPNFSGMNNLKLNDLEVIEAAPNLISEANKEE